MASARPDEMEPFEILNEEEVRNGVDLDQNQRDVHVRRDEELSSVTRRPSYYNFQGATGLHPSMQVVDFRVIKKLDGDFDDVSTIAFEEEKLKTYLRIRPHSAAPCSNKTKNSHKKVIQIKDDRTIIAYPNQKTVNTFGRDRLKQTEFKFTRVLGPECGQSTVFDICVLPLLEKFLRNENCLIFSYGATNSGKTFSLQGHGTQYGIIPRTLESVFNMIQERLYKQGNIKPHFYEHFHQLNPTEVEFLQTKKEKLIRDAASIKQDLMIMHSSKETLASSFSSSKSGSTVKFADCDTFDQVKFALYTNTTMLSIWVSFAELYNEKVYDLLEATYIGNGKAKRRKELRLLQDKKGFVYIKDLTEIHVTSADEAYKIFLAGKKNLQFAATQMNERSSRSHSFFTLRVVTIGVGNELTPFPVSVHRLTFCDLAGMERSYQTENEGSRLKESSKINNSLIALLKIIRILREKQLHGDTLLETVPFRESKLTHIFKSYFTSSTHICMLVNVNPDPLMAESTLQVLHNSAVASNVVVFRPLEVPLTSDEEELVQQRHKNKAAHEKKLKPTHQRKNTPRHHKGKAFESTSSSDNLEKHRGLDSSSTDPDSAEKSGMSTVVRPVKLLKQRIVELEKENWELLMRLEQCELEKEQIREQSVKLLVEQNRLWNNRNEVAMKTEESVFNRRLSLMRHHLRLSPGSSSSRNCNPPVLEMENIQEFDEESKDLQ